MARFLRHYLSVLPLKHRWAKHPPLHQALILGEAKAFSILLDALGKMTEKKRKEDDTGAFILTNVIVQRNCGLNEPI